MTRIRSQAAFLAVLAVGAGCGKIGYDLDDENPSSLGTDGAATGGGAGGASDGSHAGGGGRAGAGGTATGDGGPDSDAEIGVDGGAGSYDANDGDAIVDDGGGDASSDAAGDAGSNCPSIVLLTKPTPTGRHGWTGGGSNVFTDICPAGQVVVGYVIYESVNPSPDSIGRIQTLCGTVNVASSPCRVTVSPGATLPLRGRFSDRPPVTQQCPPDQMVVAFRGRSSGEVNQIAFGCAPIVLTPSGFGYRTTVGAITWFAPVGGPGGTPFQDGCLGGVATGSDIYAKSYVDAFGLYCSTLAVTP